MYCVIKKFQYNIKYTRLIINSQPNKIESFSNDTVHLSDTFLCSFAVLQVPLYLSATEQRYPGCLSSRPVIHSDSAQHADSKSGSVQSRDLAGHFESKVEHQNRELL